MGVFLVHYQQTYLKIPLITFRITFLLPNWKHMVSK